MFFPSLLLVCSAYMLGLRIWQYRTELPVTNIESSVHTEIETQSSPETEKLNLNTATKEDLMKLEGIGEKTAERILEKREQLGEFKVIEQLIEVKGIGEKSFEKIKEFIKVE